jgi:DNA-binding transcriptional MocR family regulator
VLKLELQRGSGATLTEQIVDAVRGAVDSRAIKAGTRLPSVRGLAQTQGLSTFTVSEAYARLVSLGYLVARRGAGYTVASRSAPSASLVAQRWEAPALNATWLLSDVYADHSIPIKAGAGWLPGEWLNEAGLLQALKTASRMPGGRLSGYGHPYGLPALRDTLAESFGQYGIAAQSSQVVLTHGATQALDLVVRTLLRPGDTVLVEDPGYCNLLQILRLANLTVIGVPRTRDGLDIAMLEDAVRTHEPKALFLNTTLQNPTGSTLSTAAAFRILQIAEHYRLLVVEDDISRELAPTGSPMLAAMDGFNRVVYIGGFSKTVTPSLRVGYAVANPDISKALARAKMAVGLTSSEVTEQLAYTVLTAGHYARHTRDLAERLRQQQDHVVERMEAHGLEVFLHPEGGMFVWARLRGMPDDFSASPLATEALQAGIWLAPGAYFRPGEQDSAWMRFNVATCDHAGLWKFLGSVRRTA